MSKEIILLKIIVLTAVVNNIAIPNLSLNTLNYALVKFKYPVKVSCWYTAKIFFQSAGWVY